MAPEKEAKKVRGVYEHPKGSGIWWIQYFDHGRRKRERVGRKGDAITLYRKRKTQILIGDKLPELNRKQVTFGELLDDVLVYAREEGRSMINYEGQAKLFRKAFGSLPAESLTAEDIRAWIRRRKVTPASSNRYRSFVSLCYRQGILAGKVKENPARLIPLKREPGGRQRFLSREEYDVILAAIGELDPEYARAFTISIHTGMRLSEQYSLLWKDVDVRQRKVHVLNSKNGDDRTIPMATNVYDAFLALKPRQVDPTKHVFARKRGGKKIASIRWFTNLLRSGSLQLNEQPLKIDDYTWHNNRHTFCSWLAIAGIPLKTIQELAGHRTIAMTARYSHLSPDHKLSAIEQLVQTPAQPPAATATAIRTAIGTKRSRPARKAAA